MDLTLTSRARPRLTVAAVALALVVGGACSAKDNPAAAPATTKAAGAPGTTAAAGSSSSAAPTTAAPTTTAAPATTKPKKEVGNTEIKAALSVEKPDLWALVNFDYMSWDAFGGFNIPLVGSDTSRAVELCEAVSEVVYEGVEETPIVIAVGVSADDIVGTPVVERKNLAGTCAPV